MEAVKLMDEIQIKLKTATSHGRLYPRYDTDANILEVESTVPRSWPYGVDIDGRIIFDIDADFILANVDILIPRRRWKLATSLEEPQGLRDMDIEFSQASVKHKSYHLPVEVQTDGSKSRVYVSIGETEQRATWVALSERCLVLVAEDRLKGFFLKLV